MKKVILSLLFSVLVLAFSSAAISDEPAQRPTTQSPPPTGEMPKAENPEKIPVEIEPPKVHENKPAEDPNNHEYLPTVIVNPVFPKKAIKKKVEGMVLVEYTVTKEGKVTDLVILEEYPLNFGFGKAALDAASRYEYKPRIIDGVAVEVKGVRTKIIWKIDY